MVAEPKADDRPKPPESFVRDCAELGFVIGGWDETTAGIFGHGAEFVGTHTEVMAFLRGWVGCETRNTREVTRYMLALTSGDVVTDRHRITPGTTIAITARPQRGNFRGDRVAIPDSIAQHFVIDDISVGNRSQFIQAGSIDGGLFAARIDATPLFELVQRGNLHRLEMTPGTDHAFGLELSMDVAETAMDVTMYVTAKDSCPPGTPFMAIVLGSFVAPKPEKRMGQAEAAALMAAWLDIVGAYPQPDAIAPDIAPEPDATP